MQEYYLAVDIGASSGRHILGWMEDGVLRQAEIHRFSNGLARKNGHLCWDLEQLFTEVKAGLRACKERGFTPRSVGIDTWALDFVLLDDSGAVLGDTVGYRDSRTAGMEQKVFARIPEAELYRRTGIQKMSINTIYHLMAVKESNPELLEQARNFLMIPDYLHYRLTGRRAGEYTNATTTQLVDAVSGEWDRELLRALGFPADIFPELLPPGTPLGPLSEAVQKEVGFCTEVVLPATHDTASAVLAVPCEGEAVYISSGTWSLMGAERDVPDCSEESRVLNYTNEGGYGHRYRYLKNIMGLWMLQSLRKEQDDRYSFEELAALAEQNEAFPSRVEVNSQRFLAPESMTQAVQDVCRETGQPVPRTVGELAAVLYQSLAECYGKTVAELERHTKTVYPAIHIVGGGCQDSYLNQLTAKATGKLVLAGPVEATALGNLGAQLLHTGAIASVDVFRQLVRQSFPLTRYEPTKG